MQRFAAADPHRNAMHICFYEKSGEDVSKMTEELRCACEVPALCNPEIGCRSPSGIFVLRNMRGSLNRT